MRVAMRGRRRVLVFVGGALLLGASSALSTEQRASDADSLVAAAEIALTQKAAIEAFRERCASGAPRQTLYVKAAVFWLSENDDPVYAAEQVEFDAKKRLRRLAEVDVSSAECLPFAKSIFDGQQNVRHRTPRAFDYLSKHLATHPMPEAKWAERETRVGCMKGGLNRGQSFDRLSIHCECVGRTSVETTTPEGRKAYWKAVSDKDETKTSQWLAKFMPSMMKCPPP
jgi:hypothetical protein